MNNRTTRRADRRIRQMPLDHPVRVHADAYAAWLGILDMGFVHEYDDTSGGVWYRGWMPSGSVFASVTVTRLDGVAGDYSYEVEAHAGIAWSSDDDDSPEETKHQLLVFLVEQEFTAAIPYLRATKIGKLFS